MKMLSINGKISITAGSAVGCGLSAAQATRVITPKKEEVSP